MLEEQYHTTRLPLDTYPLNQMPGSPPLVNPESFRVLVTCYLGAWGTGRKKKYICAGMAGRKPRARDYGGGGGQERNTVSCELSGGGYNRVE